MIAERLRISVIEAFSHLRVYARDHNIRLTDAAQALTNGTATVDSTLRRVR